jgi:hypothetical protein
MRFQNLKIRLKIKGTSTKNHLCVCQRKLGADPTTDGIIQNPSDKGALGGTQGQRVKGKVSRANGQKNRAAIGSAERDGARMIRHLFNPLFNSLNGPLETNEWDPGGQTSSANSLMGSRGKGMAGINDRPEVFLMKKCLKPLSIQPA